MTIARGSAGKLLTLISSTCATTSSAKVHWSGLGGGRGWTVAFNRSSDLGTGSSSTKTHSSLSSLDSRLLKKFGLWWFVIDVDIDGPIIGKFLKLRN